MDLSNRPGVDMPVFQPNLALREVAEKNVVLFSEGFYEDLKPDNVCRRLNERVTAFDYDGQSITIEFEIGDWMLNSWGSLHGGLTAMCADMTSGALSRILCDTYAPTVTMTMSYLRAAKANDTLSVTAQALHLGRRNAHFRTEVRSKKTGELLASGTAIHYVGGEKCTKENAK